MNRVIVKVRGRQTDAEGETNKIEMMAEGKHYFRNGKHYVLYDEQLLKGRGQTSTLLKIAADSMTLFRKGDIAYEQHFAVDRESSSVYQTPYGNLDLSVKTKQMDILYGTVSGNIDVCYALAVNGKWQGDNELHIEICAAEEESHKLN